MEARTYSGAASFLAHTQMELESHAAANNLMLGICERLVHHPEQIQNPPCLKSVHDARGLVLAAVMTPPYKVVVYGHLGDLNAGARKLVAELVREDWQVPGVLGPSEAATAVAEAWMEHTGNAHQIERRQRVYELREVLTPAPARGRLIQATPADLDLATEWCGQFHLDIFGEADRAEARRTTALRIENGDIYFWEDEGPVSMAAKVRPTGKGISISMVYTPADLRGRGYATACVAELSRQLLDSGWEYCTLHADLANASSNYIYQRIGYRPVCDFDEYQFLTPA